MRRLTTLALSALVLLMISGHTFFLAQPVSAASSIPGAKNSRIVVFPTRDQWRTRYGALPAGTPGGSGDLLWHGGNVQEHSTIFLIFWGSSWSNGSGGLTADGQVVKNYFNDIAGTAFENILTQYYDANQAHIFNEETVAGIWLDPSTPSTDTTCGGPTIEDQSIQTEVYRAINANGWPSAGTDKTYFVYTPNGDYVNAGGACSEQIFCAYHGLTNGLYGAAYAAIAYPFNVQECGAVPSSPNGNIYGDSLANLTSHEQFGAITDPDTLSGWYDSANPSLEIGDKCVWDFSAGLTHLNHGGTFALQTEYSNGTHSCVNAYSPAPSHFQVSPASFNLVASGTNLSPQTLALKNTGSGTLNWSTATLPPWLSLSANFGALAPGQSQNLTITFHIPALSPRQSYATNLVLSDPNASNQTISIPISVAVANISTTWYFAEGYTGPSFSEYLTLSNPNTKAATVTVQYFLGSGNPITKTYAVAANSRYTVLVNNEVGPNQNVSMVVTSSLPIIAERPMYFTYLGSIPGGSDVLGATQLGTSFDFGYLDTTAWHDTYLTILNQNSSAMTATIQYFPASGSGAITQVHTINANSRGTVYVNSDGVPAGRYSALVTLSAPGLVERPLYFVTAGNPGSADVVGVSTLQTDWYFAEGYLSNNFNEYYILSNPTGASDAHVTVTYLLSSGAPVIGTFDIPSGQQMIVDAGVALGYNNVNNSAVIHSDLPILAERLMLFRYTGPAGSGSSASIPGATDVLGAAAPTNLFCFAEGYTGGQFAEYLTLENPNDSAATVQVSYLPQNGSAPTVRTYTLAANTRTTVFTNGVMKNQSFSMVVSSDLPILAERPMYFIYNGNQTGGSDVVGYQGDPAPHSGASIYVSTTDANVYALNASDGSQRWHYQMVYPGSTPTVANGVVYVGTDAVYALRSSDGSLIWKNQTVGGSVGKLAVDNGVVYVVSPLGTLFALDAGTGTAIWQFYTGETTPPVVANGVVYASSTSGQFFALRASDARILWIYNSSILSSDTVPAVANGVVYFGAANETGVGGLLYAINASTGLQVWSSSQTYGQPVVANGMVYASSSPNGAAFYLYALNASDGSLQWSYKAVSATFSPPVAANGLVYVQATDDNVYALNGANGSLVWSHTAGDRFTPVVANGVLYAGFNFSSTPGPDLYALQASSGTLIWRVQVGGNLAASPTVAP